MRLISVRVSTITAAAAVVLLSVQPRAKDQGAAPQGTAPQGAPAATQAAPPAQGGRRQPAPLNFENHAGWKQIFDGATMANWDCDAEFWSIVDGALMAKSTREKPAGTIYCPWTGGEPADFELKLEVKLTGNTNSGIQYRSARNAGRGGGGGGGGAAGAAGAPGGAAAGAPAAGAPPAPQTAAAVPAPTPDPVPCSMAQYAGAGRGGGGGRGAGAPGQPGVAAGQRAGGAAGGGGGGRGGTPNPRSVGGYQLDLHNNGSYPGQLYENGGNGRGGANRGIITYKGQVVQLIEGERPQTIGCVGEEHELRGIWNPNDWNQIHIIARGGILIHIVNGRVITVSLDEDPTIKKDKGLIAVQIEGNPVESDLTASFRNIWLKTW